MLYTRRGDQGTSSLFGSPARFPKNSPVYEALGAIDELNSLLGVCRAKLANQFGSSSLAFQFVLKMQENLFIIQAEIAGAAKTLSPTRVTDMEGDIGQIETLLTPINSFIIPGGGELSSLFDYARAVSRRAERRVVAISSSQGISPHTLSYLNRMSSLLYALARFTAPASSQKSPSY